MITSTFYGTSSVHVTDGETGIFIDAFLSRPNLPTLLFRPLRSDPEAIDVALARGSVDTLDALFVSHAHHDHLMDAPAVITKVGGDLYGSRSSLNVARRSGIDEARLHELVDGAQVDIGKFRVSVVEAPHSPGNVAPGVIDSDSGPVRRVLDFKDGGCFVFHIRHPLGSILVLPSANYRPGFLRGVRADVMYLGIGSLGRQSKAFREAYWANTAAEVQPQVVIPVHWDHFGRPLSKPFKNLPWPADNVGASKSFLLNKTAEAGCRLHFPTPFDVYRLG